MDLSAVKDLDFIPPEESECIFINDINFDEAKQTELDSWKKENVYNECEDTGQKCISTRWVCTVKERDDMILYKARLVARGFEEDGLCDLQKDSPTCSRESLKVIMSVIGQKNWNIYSIDIKTAFLQGNEVTIEVYLKPPKEANANGKTWLLNKCVYGLSDASLKWYEKVKTTLLKTGGKLSKVDPAVFYWYKNKKLTGIIAVHVDDFLWAGTEEFEPSVIDVIRERFQIGKEESECFKYIGLNLSQNGNTLIMNQHDYSENLKNIEIDKRTSREATLSEPEKTILRGKLGQLMWLANQSRPDICFDVCNLATRVKNSTVQQLYDCNKIIRRAKADTVNLCFQQLTGDLRLEIFSDASFGNLPDGGSQGGHIILLCGDNQTFNPLAWQSKKIRRIVRSTLASETLALADAIDNGIFLATLLSELLYDNPEKKIPINCSVDNKDLYAALYSNKHVTEKRLRLEISSLKEMLSNRTITKIDWISTKHQLADILTKNGVSSEYILKTLKIGTF